MRLLLGALVVAYIGLGGPAIAGAATGLCGHDMEGVDDAAAFVRAANLKLITRANGFVAYEDRAALAIWTFTEPGHEAYPSVACRQVVSNPEGRQDVKTQLRCEAQKDVCDRLMAAFMELNLQMRQALERRDQ